MKDSIKSAPYFSAYSLKALNLSSSATNNKNLNRQFARIIKRLRVLPMANSYSKKTSINKINIPVTIHPADKNWFTNYE